MALKGFRIRRQNDELQMTQIAALFVWGQAQERHGLVSAGGGLDARENSDLPKERTHPWPWKIGLPPQFLQRLITDRSLQPRP